MSLNLVKFIKSNVTLIPITGRRIGFILLPTDSLVHIKIHNFNRLRASQYSYLYSWILIVLFVFELRARRKWCPFFFLRLRCRHRKSNTMSLNSSVCSQLNSSFSECQIGLNKSEQLLWVLSDGVSFGGNYIKYLIYTLPN